MRLSLFSIDGAGLLRQWSALVLCTGLAGPLAAQDPANGVETHARAAAAPALHAVRAPTLPRIDGQLDDDAWNEAPIARDFVQFRPDPGRPASERTEVRVLYTDDAVYIGARMFVPQRRVVRFPA